MDYKFEWNLICSQSFFEMKNKEDADARQP